MFRGNKLVIILPVILMVFLFAGGGYYINQSEDVTNESLSENVSWERNFETKENQDVLTAAWEWDKMPSDGLKGTDYIGVTFLDRSGDPIANDRIQDFQLTLDQNTRNGIEVQGKIVDHGMLFPIPNTMEENETIGNSGNFRVVVESKAESGRAVISYLHTWEEHDGINPQNARFFNPGFQGKSHNNESFYWVMEKFVDHNSNEMNGSMQ